MITLIVAAALMQVGDPCQAVPQGSTHRSCAPLQSVSRTQRFEIFAYPASIARSGDTVELSLRIVYVADQPEGHRSAVARDRFDCANRTRTTLQLTLYDAAGTILSDGPTSGDEATPRPIPRGTPGDALLTEYCPH